MMVRTALARARHDYAARLTARGGPLAALADRILAMSDRIEVWATEGDRIAATELRRASAATGEQWVGLADIARRLDVTRGTADNWRYRGVLPEPDDHIGGRPAWKWSTIEGWARRTGRL